MTTFYALKDLRISGRVVPKNCPLPFWLQGHQGQRMRQFFRKWVADPACITAERDEAAPAPPLAHGSPDPSAEAGAGTTGDFAAVHESQREWAAWWARHKRGNGEEEAE